VAARTPPARHWRSYGDDPLPTPAEATGLGEPEPRTAEEAVPLPGAWCSCCWGNPLMAESCRQRAASRSPQGMRGHCGSTARIRDIVTTLPW
jgi:hypothetical protein